MSHLQYLIVLALCVAITLPLEIVLGARVYRRPRPLVVALLAVAVVFSAWDVVAIAAGWWSYNPAYVTGWRLPAALPVEELAFFVVIPLCGLLSYEAVGRVLARLSRRPG